MTYTQPAPVPETPLYRQAWLWLNDSVGIRRDMTLREKARYAASITQENRQNIDNAPSADTINPGFKHMRARTQSLMQTPMGVVPNTPLEEDQTAWGNNVGVYAAVSQHARSSIYFDWALKKQLRHPSNRSVSQALNHLLNNGYDDDIKLLKHQGRYKPPGNTHYTAYPRSSVDTTKTQWTRTTQADPNRFFLPIVGDDSSASRRDGFQESAQSLASLLQTQYGLPQANTMPSSLTRQALQNNLKTLGKQLMQTPDNITPEVIIYYNGHGDVVNEPTPDNQTEGSAIGSWTLKPDEEDDGQPLHHSAPMSTGLVTESEIKQWIKDYLPERAQVTLINSSCHSGAMVR
jgi:hypothetical protein